VAHFPGNLIETQLTGKNEFLNLGDSFNTYFTDIL
jgi:hypothetical protein